jgi:hypothetical protein
VFEGDADADLGQHHVLCSCLTAHQHQHHANVAAQMHPMPQLQLAVQPHTQWCAAATHVHLPLTTRPRNMYKAYSAPGRAHRGTQARGLMANQPVPPSMSPAA